MKDDEVAIKALIEMALKKCNDIELLDLIYKLLKKVRLLLNLRNKSRSIANCVTPHKKLRNTVKKGTKKHWKT